MPEIRERVAVLEAAATAVAAKKLTAARREKAQAAAHKLAGVLGTFSLTRGTVLARELEVTIPRKPRPALTPASGLPPSLPNCARSWRIGPLRARTCEQALRPQELHFSQVTRHDSSPQHLDVTPQLDLRFDEPRPARHIWPVHELVAQVRELVEQEFGDVWVEGEISNFRPAPSGHVYFTLKDAEAQLPIVLFRRNVMLLRFRPEDGLHVLVRGRLSVYEQRGQMQLVAETMEPVGAGSLQLAFEQLKEQLKAEGLFDAARKRPLPLFPRTVGIITSPTGAVIRDFLNIVSRRHSGLNVLLCPASVQGESAPAEIESALAELNSGGLVDLIVLARGGGSLEDLAAFNSERVARAIVASHLPVVSAVGHETDFTIADFAADLRAPTPSAAAELITEAQHKIAEASRRAFASPGTRRGLSALAGAPAVLPHVEISRAESRVSALLHRLAQRLDEAVLRLDTAHDSSTPRTPESSDGAGRSHSASRPAPQPGSCARAPRRFSCTPRALNSSACWNLPRQSSALSTRACIRFHHWPCSIAAMRWFSRAKERSFVPPRR